MKKFELCGITSPGTVDLPNLGMVDLELLPENIQEELYKDGLPYLRPTPEYRKVLFPEEKPITNEPIIVKPVRKTTRRKSKN